MWEMALNAYEWNGSEHLWGKMVALNAYEENRFKCLCKKMDLNAYIRTGDGKQKFDNLNTKDMV